MKLLNIINLNKLIEFGFWKFKFIHDIIIIYLINKKLFSIFEWFKIGWFIFHSLLLHLMIVMIFRLEIIISKIK